MCGIKLDDPARPIATASLGGDCRECMAAVDPDCAIELFRPTLDAVAGLLALLDGAGTPAEVVAMLRARKGRPVALDPDVLATLVEAYCDGGARPMWGEVPQGWWNR
jgi:hypothetical protein